MYTGRSKHKSALCLAQHFQTDAQMFGRPKLVGFISPFNDANARIEKIFLKSKIHNFIWIVQSIQIKMVEWRPDAATSMTPLLVQYYRSPGCLDRSHPVFFQEGKRRATHHLLYTHPHG